MSKTPEEKQELKRTIIDKFILKREPSKQPMQIQVPEPAANITPLSGDNVFEVIDEEPDRNRTFHYLEDDPLSKIDVDLSLRHKLYLFLYRIEENFEEPFIQVYFIKREKMYALPQSNVVDVSTENDSQVFDHLSLFFEKTTELTHDDAVNKYKGFIETEDELRNPCIVGVFGSINTEIVEKTEMVEENKSVWAIADEIFFKRRILDVPIKEFIVKMVNDYPFLMCIKDKNGNPTNVPHLMYLCENDTNVYYEETEDRNNSYQLMHVRKNHALFNSTYLFSTEPLEFNNLSRIKRFAVVVKDPLYLLNHDFPVTDFKNVDINHTTCFYEGNREFWSVKNENSFMQL